ncbi:MAG: c-type cytochrome [Planctomycetota bacterium]
MSTRVTILATGTFAALMAFIGCQTLDQLAPPVGEPTLREASVSNVAAENLERGRTIYISQCTRCHTPEPVTRYSEARWRETLPRMSMEAMLTPQETADVRDYVMVTLRAMTDAAGGP